VVFLLRLRKKEVFIVQHTLSSILIVLVWKKSFLQRKNKSFLYNGGRPKFNKPELHSCNNNGKRVCGLTIKFANFDIREIVHYEFVPTGETVNQVYYLEVLKKLRKKVRRKRPELFANNSWILHHDNAPAHTHCLRGRF